MGIDITSFRHLDLKHMRQLTVVAKCRSIRAAAASLSISQPALSRSLRAIEDDLGIALVERSAQGASLTIAGETLAKYAKIIEANLSLAAQELHQNEEYEGTEISFGVSWSANSILVGDVIQAVLEERPNIHMSYRVGDYEDQAPMLMSGQLDFIIGLPPLSGESPGVNSEFLMDVPAVPVVRASHPLATKNKVTLKDLISLDWMLPGKGTRPRITYDNFFLSQGVSPPEPIIEVPPLAVTWKPLLLNRNIATIVPLIAVEKDVLEGTIKSLPFYEEKINFRIYLTKHDLKQYSAGCEYVIGEFRRRCGELSRPT